MEVTEETQEKSENNDAQIDIKDSDQSAKSKNKDDAENIKNQDSQVLQTTDDNVPVDIFESNDNSEVKTDSKESTNTVAINDPNKIEDKIHVDDEIRSVPDVVKPEELEDGECSDSASEESESESESNASTSTVSDEGKLLLRLMGD